MAHCCTLCRLYTRITRVGQYSLSFYLNGRLLGQTPFQLSVLPGPPFGLVVDKSGMCTTNCFMLPCNVLQKRSMLIYMFAMVTDFLLHPSHVPTDFTAHTYAMHFFMVDQYGNMVQLQQLEGKMLSIRLEPRLEWEAMLTADMSGLSVTIWTKHGPTVTPSNRQVIIMYGDFIVYNSTWLVDSFQMVCTHGVPHHQMMQVCSNVLLSAVTYIPGLPRNMCVLCHRLTQTAFHPRQVPARAVYSHWRVLIGNIILLATAMACVGVGICMHCSKQQMMRCVGDD